MRNLIYLFALYLAVLQAIPCIDAGIHNWSNPVRAEAGHDRHDHDIADACSPFCTCSCCSVIVMVSCINFDGKPKKIDAVTIFPQYQDFNPTYFSNFWQPPKIS